MSDKKNQKKPSPESHFFVRKNDGIKSKENQHVIRRDDGWAVRTEGNSRDTFRATSQREAIGHAREIAKTKGAEVIVYGRDGKIAAREVFKVDDWELVAFDTERDKSSDIDLNKYIDRRYFGNRPHIRGRRVLVSMVAANAEENNWGVSQLAQEFTLTEEQVLATLLYYREHKAEIDEQDLEEQRQFDEDYRLRNEADNS